MGYYTTSAFKKEQAMKLKTAVLAVSLVFSSASSFAAEPVSLSSIFFRSVNHFSGTRSVIVFEGVRWKDTLWEVAVPVENVEVILVKENKIYTTLNLMNTQEDYGSLGWMKAEKAVVVVRQEKDLILWQKFLTRVRKQQELEKKKWTEPIRVLPPVME